MPYYRHKQTGTLVLWFLGSAAALCVALLFLVGLNPPPGTIVSVVLVLLLLFAFIFASLTVEVTADRVSLWFGPGLIRRSFPATDIRNATAVRNRWYYGWGIRLTPHGWLFNVSGLDAVQIELSNGRTYRIGTDEPRELLAAIRRVSGTDNSDK